jgi:integrating conjugative element membrane protein (TIGR03747 family)
MAAKQQASAQQTVEQGLIGRLLTRMLVLVFFLLLTLLLSVFTEWVGMTLIWPEQGSQHSAQMLEQELDYLNDDFKHNVIVEQPKRFAKRFGDVYYKYIIEASGISTLIRWLTKSSNKQHPETRSNTRNYYQLIATYLLAAVTSIEVFVTRIAVLTLAFPAFILLGLVGLIDGLVKREIRRWSGGRESSWVYHWAKIAVLPSLYLPWIVYLSMPVSVHPNFVVLPFALLCALAIAVMATTFKKYV